MTSKLHAIIEETTPITPTKSPISLTDTPAVTSKDTLQFFEEECHTFLAYKTFINQHLPDWKLDPDFTHFDTSYTTYQMLRPQSRELRRQAKSLIEMAARLELLENTHKNQVDQILPKLAVKGFNQKIAKLRRNNPIHKISSPRQTPPPFIHRPIRPDPRLKCYRCESSQHLMKDCCHYYCRHCHRSAPGHYNSDCMFRTNTTT